MHVTAYKTKKVAPHDDLFAILVESLPADIPDNSIVAVSSKIVALCQGRVADPTTVTKDQLVEREAELYLPRSMNKYDFSLSIKHHTFIASGGVDESNGNGLFVLWPEDPQRAANDIRTFLQQQYGKKHIGVIITDSKTSPLRWGVTGVAITYSGFQLLNSYVGKPDIFGRLLKVEKVNVADTIAAAAVGEMGEGNEQTPLAVVSDIPWVTFVDQDPTPDELASLRIALEDDMYAPLLTSVAWKKGKGK